MHVDACSLEHDAVRLTHATKLFDATAEHLLWRLRVAMYIPSVADESTEREFLRLREKLDDYFPEFRELFGGLLVERLGAHAADVLRGLAGEELQLYFQASDRIRRDVEAGLNELSRAMQAAVVG